VTAAIWIGWSLVTVAFNAINSANSRAKNSRSLKFNGATTFLAALLYILSILGVGNLLIESRHAALAVAIVAYASLSTVGSVVGQKLSMKFESSHNIKK
jgi:hypothetical protein